MDTKLRKTVESSVEEQFKFVSKIGRSQMENEIANRVKVITKRSAKILEENTGIQTQLEDNEVEEYIRVVLEDREKMMKRTDSANDGEI
jgi:hypothetical protein